MRQGSYNFRDTKARQNRILDLQSKQSSTSVQGEIEFNHTDTEEIFCDQDNNMGDRDDRNTGLGEGKNVGPDQGEVLFRQLLGTLEKGQCMQQEQNRQMDMMLQLMARQMGIPGCPFQWYQSYKSCHPVEVL